MASLDSKTPSTAPLSLVVNKLATLLLFIILLVAGWITVSYLKSGNLSKAPSVTTSRVRVAADGTSSVAQRKSGADRQVPEKLSPLVYSTESDAVYYHASSHRPTESGRVAMSEDAARRRGLKPCTLCIRH